MDSPKRSFLATIFMGIMDAIACLALGLMALLFVAAAHSSGWPTENPILAAIIGTLTGAITILGIIGRINRRLDPRHQKRPPDAP